MTFDRQGRGPRMIGMMGVILGCALGFGAIKSPSPFGGQVVVVCATATFVVATFGAILSTPKAFWFGFASFGWASMLLAAEFWFDHSPYDANILGAAIFARYFPQQYQESLRRFAFGLPQYRKIVFCQIAVIQGLIGGFAALVLSRTRVPGLRRFDRPRSVWFPAVLAIASSLLALRYCITIGATVYVQAVTTLLVAASLGSFVGSYRRACAGAALLGWAVLLWNVYGPLPKHGVEQTTMVGRAVVVGNVTKIVFTQLQPDTTPRNLAETVYAFLYPKTLRMDAFDDVEPGSWAEWRSRLLGEPESETRPVRGTTVSLYSTWGLSHFRRFALVIAHAAALLAMLIGALVGEWLDRRRRRTDTR